jgi:phage FluMu gp28-like protein
MVKPGRVTIDQTGVGQKFVEDAQREILDTAIEGVVFTNAGKERWATAFKGDMQQRLVSWPNLADLKRQIHGIKRTKTEANFYRFSGTHDDYFWSLMLALYGSANRVEPRISFL